MKLGLKILLSLNLAVCLSASPLLAMEDGNDRRDPVKRLSLPAPRPLEAAAAPNPPLKQNLLPSRPKKKLKKYENEASRDRCAIL